MSQAKKGIQQHTLTKLSFNKQYCYIFHEWIYAAVGGDELFTSCSNFIGSGQQGMNRSVTNFCGLTETCEIAFRWMQQDLFDNKSTVIQCCCQQTRNQYANQGWPSSMMIHGINRSQSGNISKDKTHEKSCISIWNGRILVLPYDDTGDPKYFCIVSQLIIQWESIRLELAEYTLGFNTI